MHLSMSHVHCHSFLCCRNHSSLKPHPLILSPSYQLINLQQLEVVMATSLQGMLIIHTCCLYMDLRSWMSSFSSSASSAFSPYIWSMASCFCFTSYSRNCILTLYCTDGGQFRQGKGDIRLLGGVQYHYTWGCTCLQFLLKKGDLLNLLTQQVILSR